MAYPYYDYLSWLFPALPVTLYRENNIVISPPLLALLDTGADATFVPANFLEQGSATRRPRRL